MQKQSLTTSHGKADAQPVPEQKMHNLPRPPYFPLLLLLVLYGMEYLFV